MIQYGLASSDASPPQTLVLQPALVSGGWTNVRNDGPYFAGMTFTPTRNLVVYRLGRWKWAGNSQTHIVKLTNYTTQVDVPGGSVTVDCSTGSVGSYIYASLTEPITLISGTQYYLTSYEAGGGDNFGDFSPSGFVVPNVDISGIEVAYWSGSWSGGFFAGQSLEPVNMLYE